MVHIRTFIRNSSVHIERLSGKRSDSKHKHLVFKFNLDLTPILLRFDGNDCEWHELHVVRDGDGKEADRGDFILSLIW
jgi:hypothetical protein